MKAAMERGVVDAYHYMQKLTLKTLEEKTPPVIFQWPSDASH